MKFLFQTNVVHGVDTLGELVHQEASEFRAKPGCLLWQSDRHRRGVRRPTRQGRYPLQAQGYGRRPRGMRHGELFYLSSIIWNVKNYTCNSKSLNSRKNWWTWRRYPIAWPSSVWRPTARVIPPITPWNSSTGWKTATPISTAWITLWVDFLNARRHRAAVLLDLDIESCFLE